MNKIILADSQAIFRAGTAKVLAMDDDLRIIAQCTDLDRLLHAITTFPGCIVFGGWHNDLKIPHGLASEDSPFVRPI